MTLLFAEHGSTVACYDKDPKAVEKILETAVKADIEDSRVHGFSSLDTLVKAFAKGKRRIFVLSLPHGTVADGVADELLPQPAVADADQIVAPQRAVLVPLLKQIGNVIVRHAKLVVQQRARFAQNRKVRVFDTIVQHLDVLTCQPASNHIRNMSSQAYYSQWPDPPGPMRRTHGVPSGVLAAHFSSSGRMYSYVSASSHPGDMDGPCRAA